MYVWIGVLVLFLVVEAVTWGLVSIWFAVGAVAGLISCLAGAEVWAQIIWFLVISFVALVGTRPLVKKYLLKRKDKTNADRIFDMTGVVTQRINNIEGFGEVLIGGKKWSATSEHGNIIEKEALVRPCEIIGAHISVELAEES